MEKMMSKMSIHNTEGRDELTVDQLDQVVGGLFLDSIPAMLRQAQAIRQFTDRVNSIPLDQGTGLISHR
jgi:hypothetical protein